MAKKPTYEDLEQRIRAFEKEKDASKGFYLTPKNPEAVYRLMLESISDTVIVTDDQGNMLYVCPNSAIIFGLSQDEILSLNTVQKLMDGSICDTSDLKEQGKLQNIEWTIKDANGQTRFLLINVKSVNINGGTVLYVMRDITDRKQEEEDLKRYRNIVSSTPDGISLVDRNYRYVIINDAYEKASGVDRENLVGVTISEYLGKEVFEKYIQPNFDKCLQGETINYQEWFEYPTLGKRFKDITYYPYGDSGDNITGVVANTRDITSQRLAEEALKESEKKFRDLIERQNDVLYRMSLPDGAYEYVSPAAVSVFGYSPKEIIDNPLFIQDIIHPDYIDYFQKEWPALKEGKVRPIYEYKLIDPEGNDRWIVQSNIGVFDHQGNIIAIEGICRDVTECKQVEEVLKQEATWRRILVDQSRDGIVVVDQNGKVYEANQRYTKMLGYSMEEVHQLHVWDWDAQWSKGQLLEMIQAVDERGDHFETRHRRKDGTIYDVEISTNGAIYRGQKLIFCVCRDITDRKQAEEALKISKENLLEESNQRKILSKRVIDLLEKDRHEIAMELHDNIGQILTSLKIYLEIIDDKLKPIDTELGSLTKAAIKRANQAINDLNNIARGLMPSILDPLGLVPSLRALLSEFREQTDIKIDFFNRNVQKRFDKEKELAIYRIVQEALNNIIKHAEAKNVYVNLLKKGNVLSLSVEDNGVGFDQEKAMKITKGKGPLGLVIMRERAMQLDGELTIESFLGKGAHLLAEIPI